jgi:hypothetical protein
MKFTIKKIYIDNLPYRDKIKLVTFKFVDFIHKYIEEVTSNLQREENEKNDMGSTKYNWHDCFCG